MYRIYTNYFLYNIYIYIFIYLYIYIKIKEKKLLSEEFIGGELRKKYCMLNLQNKFEYTMRRI
jgi:hypothetical protein